MPEVMVRAFKRTQKQKEMLAKAITKDICKIFDVSGDQVRIYFEDRVKSNYFINAISTSRSK